MIKCLLAVVLVIVHALSACSRIAEPDKPPDSATGPATLVLINCILIDGTGAPPIPNATLVISGEVILSGGPANQTSVPEGALILDVGGGFVLPGFINAHVHNGFSSTNLQAWARDGVTTVRDMAGPSLFSWRDEILQDPTCALLVAAGPMVSVPGGYPQVPWGSPYMLPVTSPHDAVNKVTDLLEQGADFVKLAVESGENFGMTIPSLTPEEALAAVNTAHQHATVVSAHVLMAGDLARAIDAGADDIAHMIVNYLSPSLINRMVADSTVWVPTLELWHHVGYGYRGIAQTNLGQFVAAGGMVALGTDYAGYDATFQSGMPTDEMVWMVAAGMTPMQVIVAGTKHAARVCNLSDVLGTLEPGKLADVIILTGDPLADIQNLADVCLVIHRGTVIHPAEP